MKSSLGVTVTRLRTALTDRFRLDRDLAAGGMATGPRSEIMSRRWRDGKWLATREPADPTHHSYDVAPDGAHFLVLRRAGADAKAIVVHNWRRALRETMQSGKR